MIQKKYVIVKHMNNDGRFLFQVPNHEYLDAGDMVICDTSKGKDQMGVCLCDSFLAEPEMICRLFGVKPENMRFVTGVVSIRRFEPKADEDEE